MASPQNSPTNSTKGRFRRLRAKAQAANSIAVKEELFNFSFFGGPFIFRVGYSVTLHRGARNEETRMRINTEDFTGMEVDRHR